MRTHCRQDSNLHEGFYSLRPDKRPMTTIPSLRVHRGHDSRLWLRLITPLCCSLRLYIYHRKTHYALTIKLTTSNDVMVIVMGLNHCLSMFIYSYHIETHYLVLTYSVGLSPATVVMCFNMISVYRCPTAKQSGHSYLGFFTLSPY